MDLDEILRVLVHNLSFGQRMWAEIAKQRGKDHDFSNYAQPPGYRGASGMFAVALVILLNILLWRFMLERFEAIEK